MSKLKRVPDSRFIGSWKYQSDNIYNGVIVNITKDKNGNFKGTIKKLNNNKLTSFFIDTNFVIFNRIERNSNFEFGITENRIAKELFGLYNLETSDKYIAQFLNENSIGMTSAERLDKNHVPIKLIRLK